MILARKHPDARPSLATGSLLVRSVPEITGKTATAGTAWSSGNRSDTPVFPPWVQRAGRALANHKENLPLFAVAVVVVHLASRADRISAMAAVGYVVARALHGLLYVAGVTKLRTVVWLLGFFCNMVLLSRLFA